MKLCVTEPKSGARGSRSWAPPVQHTHWNKMTRSNTDGFYDGLPQIRSKSRQVYGTQLKIVSGISSSKRSCVHRSTHSKICSFVSRSPLECEVASANPLTPRRSINRSTTTSTSSSTCHHCCGNALQKLMVLLGTGFDRSRRNLQSYNTQRLTWWWLSTPRRQELVSNFSRSCRRRCRIWTCTGGSICMRQRMIFAPWMI